MSGRDDAIGEFGKGVTRVYDRYKRAGIHDVSMKLYPGMRHELLHETERKQVQEDILSWIEEHLRTGVIIQQKKNIVLRIYIK